MLFLNPHPSLPQVRAALASGGGDGGHVDDDSFDLLELVASKEFELYRLFSQRQLQVPHLNRAFLLCMTHLDKAFFSLYDMPLMDFAFNH